MKKLTLKLQLKTSTLRMLDASALRQAAGGISGYWTQCSHSCNTCEGCTIDYSYCVCDSLGVYCSARAC
jgi:hypothetical protein